MKKILMLLIILAGVSIALYFWWKNGETAVNPSNKNQVIFVVQKGKGVREIANNLKNQDLIKDPIVFFLLVKKEGLDEKIQAGDFRLSPSMNTNEIIQALTHGTIDIWVTIPEGKRADEIADLLSDKIPSYEKSWRISLRKDEGFLFPDTYLIPKDADIDIVLSLMKNNFEEKYSTIANAPQDPVEKKRVVTIASMVEREARLSQDRPLVASVILNRLNIGMKLDIDATIQYVLGYQKDEKTWWKKYLTNQDLKIDSDYNTYLNNSLPPTPISNPGLSALEAAVNPAKTNYIYYISDKNGKNHYAKTLEEHNTNIQKYGL
ncbi:MAG: endolytic transglycosylase MltG [Candidatus Levybacteria bacterium]|nr:endolytic transglycosylase MltG [Candidatus Levybacteria bacterium]